jgi:hypothetical protein
MTGTKTKKKPAKAKKISTTPLNFRQLLARVQKNEAAASLLKTAVQTGWLTDTEFLTKVSEKEEDLVRQAYNGNSAAKRATPADITNALPTLVGPMVEEIKFLTNTVRMTAGTRMVEVDARLYNTMVKRHERVSVYLSPDGSVSQSVIFSGGSGTQAVLPELKDAAPAAATEK